MSLLVQGSTWIVIQKCSPICQKFEQYLAECIQKSLKILKKKKKAHRPSNRVQLNEEVMKLLNVLRSLPEDVLQVLCSLSCSSGLIVPESYSNETVPEVVAQSGFLDHSNLTF